jgi:hypothetical protein
MLYNPDLHRPREETVEAVDCSELQDSGWAEESALAGTSSAGWLGFQIRPFPYRSLSACNG